jgi:pimeloyl-ACP methyl ester carboxylesterase
MTWTQSGLKNMGRVLTFGALALGLAACGGIVDKRADMMELRAEAAFPPEGQIIDVDGVPVHAVVTGTGPDLVLIHGASGNTRDFTFQMVDRLADRYRVFVFDRPGMGYTGHTRPVYGRAFTSQADTPAEQAALLSAAARQLGAKNPVVVGQSYGGAVALAWALDHPLSALVTISAASMPWPGGLGPLYQITGSGLGGVTAVPLITAFAPRDRVDGVVEGIFAPDPVPEGYIDYIGGALSIRRDSLRSNARQVSGLKPHVAEMSKRYDQIDVPVEILHGTADQVVSIKLHSERLVDLIPNAVLTRLEGAGHMPHHSRTDAVDAAIDRAAARARLR